MQALSSVSGVTEDQSAAAESCRERREARCAQSAVTEHRRSEGETKTEAQCSQSAVTENQRGKAREDEAENQGTAEQRQMQLEVAKRHYVHSLVY